jgi:RNAse (barnase) inhibitor barstar
MSLIDQGHPLFSDQSGVYWIPSSVEVTEIEQAAQRRNFRFIQLNGYDITNRAGLFRLIQSAFEFPAHFGGNWDALLDMLRDLSWLPASGYIVFAHNLEPLSAYDHASYDHLLGVLHDATAFWANRMQNQPPMIVLLTGVAFSGAALS